MAQDEGDRKRGKEGEGKREKEAKNRIRKDFEYLLSGDNMLTTFVHY